MHRIRDGFTRWYNVGEIAPVAQEVKKKKEI